MGPYKILGIHRNATQAEIRRAYHRQAAKHHPDVGGEQWAFEQVREAYEQLAGKATDAPTPHGEPRPATHKTDPPKSGP